MSILWTILSIGLYLIGVILAIVAGILYSRVKFQHWFLDEFLLDDDAVGWAARVLWPFFVVIVLCVFFGDAIAWFGGKLRRLAYVIANWIIPPRKYDE